MSGSKKTLSLEQNQPARNQQARQTVMPVDPANSSALHFPLCFLQLHQDQHLVGINKHLHPQQNAKIIQL
ncbi:hypothetical protein R3I93_000269 [Phoxinus phoxinus]|uniref:Uncharacterized protein n=1 Tax=Phoxinus phoxinus TaxID=58324 RepID=A0AAN9HHE6_9TELE